MLDLSSFNVDPDFPEALSPEQFFRGMSSIKLAFLFKFKNYYQLTMVSPRVLVPIVGQLFLNFSCPFLIQPFGMRKIVRIQIILVKASNVIPTDFELISKALKTRKSVPLAPKQA